MFAWRLCKNGLAIQLKRKSRTLTKLGTCDICGMEDESAHHAVVRCTKAAALRKEIQQHWLLPDEQQFTFSGPDWLFLLLSRVNKETGARILLLFWRAWYLRNDSIHGKGTGSIRGSVQFLVSYSESLNIIHHGQGALPDAKGKAKIDEGCGTRIHQGRYGSGSKQQLAKWSSPQEGWVKMNSDAAFSMLTGDASAGVVVRDANGRVLLTAWRLLRRCSTVEEAEAEALLEGAKLMAEWVRQSTILEADCSMIMVALKSGQDECALWLGILAEISAVCDLLPGHRLEHANRNANNVAHNLAKLAYERREFVVKRLGFPQEVERWIQEDSKGVSGPRTSNYSSEPEDSSCNLVVP